MKRLEAIDSVYKFMTGYCNASTTLDNVIPQTSNHGDYFKGLVLGMCNAYAKAGLIDGFDYKKIKHDMHIITRSMGWE